MLKKINLHTDMNEVNNTIYTILLYPIYYIYAIKSTAFFMLVAF